MLNFFQFILWLLVGSVICRENYFETYFIEPETDQNSRNAINMERYKWPDGIVYYVFDRSYNVNDQDAILTAMRLIVEKTCVEFVMKNPIQKEHIRFLKVIFLVEKCFFLKKKKMMKTLLYKSQNGECGSNIGYRPNRTEPLDVTFTEGSFNKV